MKLHETPSKSITYELFFRFLYSLKGKSCLLCFGFFAVVVYFALFCCLFFAETKVTSQKVAKNPTPTPFLSSGEVG